MSPFEIVPWPPVFRRSVASGAKLTRPFAPTVAMTVPRNNPSAVLCTRKSRPLDSFRTPLSVPSFEYMIVPGPPEFFGSSVEHSSSPLSASRSPDQCGEPLARPWRCGRAAGLGEVFYGTATDP